MCKVGLDDDDDNDDDDDDDDTSDEAYPNVPLLLKSFIAAFKLSKSCSHVPNFSASC